MKSSVPDNRIVEDLINQHNLEPQFSINQDQLHCISRAARLTCVPLLSFLLASCQIVTDEPLVFEKFLLPLDQKHALEGMYEYQISTDEGEDSSVKTGVTEISVMDRELLFDGSPVLVSGIPYNPGIYVLTTEESRRIHLIQFAPEEIELWVIYDGNEFHDYMPEGDCEMYCIYHKEEIGEFLMEYGSQLVERDSEIVFSRID